jgi:hypothetical protein
MTVGDYGFNLTFPSDTDLSSATITLKILKPDGTTQTITSCSFSTASANILLGIAGYISWPVDNTVLTAVGEYSGQFSATGAGFQYSSTKFALSAAAPV